MNAVRALHCCAEIYKENVHPFLALSYCRSSPSAILLTSVASIAISPKLNQAFIKRVAIHFGTHLAFWPTVVQWTDEEGTKQIVRLGATVLQRAIDEDWDWLESSALGVLLR